MRKNLFLVALALVVLAIAGTFMLSRPAPVRASDHDDGETDAKTRNLNLTDVYAFREDDQNTAATLSEDAKGNPNLVVLVNTNPRSLPRQQYFFNQSAQYVVHINDAGTSAAAGAGVTAGTNVAPGGNTLNRGNETLQFIFTFGAPNANFSQPITMTVQNVANAAAPVVLSGPAVIGNTTAAPPGLGVAGGAANIDDNVTPVVNRVAVAQNGFNGNVDVFAGLREDPFFFDVTQYFRIRAGVLGDGPLSLPRSTATAVDFTKDYNVNTIALRVPELLINGNKSTNGVVGATNDCVFDVWATIHTP